VAHAGLHSPLFVAEHEVAAFGAVGRSCPFTICSTRQFERRIDDLPIPARAAGG